MYLALGFCLIVWASIAAMFFSLWLPELFAVGAVLFLFDLFFGGKSGR